VRRSNLGAIRLYEKLGYQALETWRAYYPDGEDALVLEKLRDGNSGSGSGHGAGIAGAGDRL
jgi:ribosomal protein S18 acetylase RimI-like enzyme